MYGEAEWLEEKHGKRSRRRWRKLHLAIDANSHDVVAVQMTTDDVGDVTTVPVLLDQIDGSVASVTSDGAYDADVVYDEITRRHPEADVIIPPRSTAVVSESGTTRRDEHLRTIERHGRIGWQRRSGYCRRSLVETTMFRYKTIIGRQLHARTLSNQKGGGKNRVFSPQSDDQPWHADLHPYQIDSEPKGYELLDHSSCNNTQQMPRGRASLTSHFWKHAEVGKGKIYLAIKASVVTVKVSDQNSHAGHILLIEAGRVTEDEPDVVPV